MSSYGDLTVSNVGLRGEQGIASPPSVDEPYDFPEIDMSHRIYFQRPRSSSIAKANTPDMLTRLTGSLRRVDGPVLTFCVAVISAKTVTMESGTLALYADRRYHLSSGLSTLAWFFAFKNDVVLRLKEATSFPQAKAIALPYFTGVSFINYIGRSVRTMCS